MNNDRKVIENSLYKIPVRNQHIKWISSNDSLILEVENSGFYNKLAQLIFKKPRISFIHLDKTGSFIWPIIDGEKNIYQLGHLVKNQFGDDCEPLFQRLIRYFQILEDYNFIYFK